jgi:hypothetical protein
MSLNGVDFEPVDAQFEFFSPLNLTSVWPSTIFAGANVTLAVAGMFDFYRIYRCRVGMAESSAQWVSSTLISCPCLTANTGLFQVAVSANGQDWASAGLAVQSVPVSQLLSLSPSLLPWNGGDNVTVMATAFRWTCPCLR